MALELRDLRYFVAVAEEGHVTRAAERLGMEQPPLSLRIKALERDLDVQLFIRRPRGMELTEAGRTLLACARELLGGLEHAVHATRSAARGEQGRLRLGIAPTATFHPFVPRCIREFRSAWAAVELSLSEGLSDEVRRRLLDGEIDAAFVRVAAFEDERLTVSTVLEEPLVAALPRAHALARHRDKPIASLAALRHDAFVLFGPPGTAIHDETTAACAAAGFAPRVAQLAPRITSTLGLVAAGMGIALVPASMRRVGVDGVVYRDFHERAGGKAVLGVASRHHDPSVVVKNFIACVRRLQQRSVG